MAPAGTKSPAIKGFDDTAVVPLLQKVRLNPIGDGQSDQLVKRNRRWLSTSGSDFDSFEPLAHETIFKPNLLTQIAPLMQPAAQCNFNYKFKKIKKKKRLSRTLLIFKIGRFFFFL